MRKRWVVLNDQEPSSVEDVVGCLLANRGLKDQASRDLFLSPTTSLQPEQVGLTEDQLAEAATLIKQTCEKKLPIVIHGDYDVDGLCATAILWETLYRDLDYQQVTPFIPNRFEHGYGLSKASVDAIVDTLKKDQTRPLLITVDCGITSHEAVTYAQSLGFRVLLTDHHQPGESLPTAEALVWTDQVCGAAIAGLLAETLVTTPDPGSGDLVALATVADLQPLLGPNRSLVKQGLEQMHTLHTSPRVGLRALAEAAGIADKEIGTYEIGWLLAPRLNAGGRLEGAMDALRLLCTRSQSQAQELARKLSQLNTERQQMTEEQVTHARTSLADTSQPILIAAHESYHEGVIGLIAGKLVQRFYRPALAISKGAKLSKGSARSIPEFNIIEALRRLEDVFEGVGGHPAAAGFTIRTERISDLEERLAALAAEQLADLDLAPALKIESLLPPHLLSWELEESLRQFTPFGLGNRRPLFLTRGARVEAARAVGKNDKHLKASLSFPESPQEGWLDGIGFGLGYLAGELGLDTSVEVVYSLEENIWNGRRSLQLNIKGIKGNE